MEFRFRENKFLRYSFGGLINYGLKIIITSFLIQAFSLCYSRAYTIALISATIFGFFYSSCITFKNQDNKTRNFIKYLFALACVSLIDFWLFRFLAYNLHIAYILSITLTTFLIFITKFLIYNKLVFNVKH